MSFDNIITPISAWVGKKFGEVRVSTASKTDRRIRLMNEIVNGMKAGIYIFGVDSNAEFCTLLFFVNFQFQIFQHLCKNISKTGENDAL